MMCLTTIRSVFAAALFLCGGALFFPSCSKDGVPAGVPKCIKTKIEAIKNEPVHNPASRVYSYTYQGRTVYYFSSYCCDIPGELYDENCNLICQPDGGITGQGDGRCSDFFTARSNEKLIWKDTR